jgi:hypothetical protein
MFVYGGSINNRPTNEFWSYNFSSGQWNFMLPVGDVNVSEPMLNVSHHTATVVDHVMIVIFGMSHRYSYVSTVQEYDFETNTWRYASTSGSSVSGSAGHASVYVEAVGLIFVYGGLRLDSHGKTVKPSDHMMVYHPTWRQWSLLKGSGFPRYFHSMALMGNLLVAFGGSSHTDVTESTGTLCYSDDAMAYDFGMSLMHNQSNYCWALAQKFRTSDHGSLLLLDM